MKEIPRTDDHRQILDFNFSYQTGSHKASRPLERLRLPYDKAHSRSFTTPLKSSAIKAQIRVAAHEELVR